MSRSIAAPAASRVSGGATGVAAHDSILQQQLALLEQDTTTWKSKRAKARRSRLLCLTCSHLSLQVDQKRRRLERAQERMAEEERERASRREHNVKAMASELQADDSANRNKKRAFAALQKKTPAPVNVAEAEAGMERTSLFDFGDDDELVEKEALRPVESDDEGDDSESSAGEVKIFRFPDGAD